MSFAAIEYIKQEYPTAKYSEIYYLSSAASPLNIVVQNFANQNVVAIFTHFIYWTVTNSAAIFSFKDQFGQILCTLTDSGSTEFLPIPMVRKGSLLKVTCSLPAIVFTVSFQYLMQDVKK